MPRPELSAKETKRTWLLTYQTAAGAEAGLRFSPQEGLLVGACGPHELRPKASNLLERFVDAPERTLSHAQIKKEVLHLTEAEVPKRELAVADRNTRNLVSEIRQGILAVTGQPKSDRWPIANQHRAFYQLKLEVKQCWVPHPLPSPATHFVRSVNYCLPELEAQLLNPAARVISFYGRAGSGKTSLLAPLLAEMAKTGELRRGSQCLEVSGIYYYSRRNWVDILSTTLEADLQREPGHSQNNGDTAASETPPSLKLKQLLQRPAFGCRLFIIDDIDDYDFVERDLADEDLRYIIQSVVDTAQSKLLLISPAYPVGLIVAYGQQSAKVGIVPDALQGEVLTQMETGQLLTQLALQNTHPLLSRAAPLSQTATTQLHQRIHLLTGGHPKAVTQLYEWMITEGLQSVDELTARLGATLPQQIPAAISQRYLTALPEQDRVVLKTLAIFKQPMRTDDLQTVLAGLLPLLNAESTLQRLKAGNLVLQKDEGSFLLHSVEQSYCWELVRQDLNQPRLLNGIPTSRELCVAVARYLQRVREKEEERDFPDFDKIRQSAIATVDLLSLAGAHDEAAQILLAFDRSYMMYTNQWRELKPRYLALLDKVPDREHQAHLLNRYGTVLLCLGEIRAAIPFYLRSQALGEQLNHLEIRLKTANNLASCHYLQGQLSRAYACFAEACDLAVAQGLPHERRVADLVSGMADCLVLLGEPEKALTMQKQALEIGEEWLDHYPLTSQNYRGVLSFIAHQHKQIAICQRELGDYDAALPGFDEAIKRAEEIGNRATLGYTLYEQAEAGLLKWYRAVLSGKVSQFEEAGRNSVAQYLQQLRRALRLGNEIGNPELQHHSTVLLTLINLHDADLPPTQTAEHLRVLESTRDAAQTDPTLFRFETRLLSAICAYNAEDYLLAARHFERTETEIKRLLADEPRFVRAHEALAQTYLGLALCRRRNRAKASGKAEREAALNHYRTARSLTSAAGSITRALYWYDALRHGQNFQEVKACCERSLSGDRS